MNNLPEDFEIKFSNHKGSKATQFPLNDEIINKAKLFQMNGTLKPYLGGVVPYQ